MLGTLYSSASGLSSLSHSRDLFTSPGFCLEPHETAIEERYCPNQHFTNGISDGEWDLLLAHEAQLYDAVQHDDAPALIYYENEPLFYPEELTAQYPEEQLHSLHTTFPSSPLPKPNLTRLDTASYAADADADPGMPPLTPSPTSSSFSGDVYDLPSTPVSATFPAQPHSKPPPSHDQDRCKTDTQATSQSRKRPRTSGKSVMPRKRLCRASSSTSISTVSSITSSTSGGSVVSITGSSTAPITSANAPLRMPDPNSANPWKCPHCTWVQHTKRLPDFLRHQRSHFVSESDWPCPNPKCGKGFARKDSLKRHLDNRATGCKRPPGYTIC